MPDLVARLVTQLLAGEQRALSRVMTMIERGDPAAAALMREVDPHTGRAYVIGITGPPGSGKSTIVDRLTGLLRQKGNSVGIIAVDPTSPFTGGAILGDRIRMQRHYLDPDVFIRSVATRGQSGGLSRVVKSLVRLLDAAGKDIILVETVGVGQTELGIMGVGDTILVVLMPESGDAVQTLKAGVMEIADLYLVNKADRPGAGQMADAITSTLQMALSQPEWTPPVLLTRAEAGEGMKELWDRIEEHRLLLEESSQLGRRQEVRRKEEFLEAVEEEMGRRWRVRVESDSNLANLLRQVADKQADPYSAAIEFLDSQPNPLE